MRKIHYIHFPIRFKVCFDILVYKLRPIAL